jgi:hypothetical protein
MPSESVCYQGCCWGSSGQMISAWSAETHVAIRFQQSKTSVIRLHAMPKVLASMEKTPCMNEDDHIKQLLRFTSEDELIRLAEIGLAVEMHQAAQRFFRGRTDVPYTEETAAKLKAYLEPNPGGSCSPKVMVTRPQKDIFW